MIQGPPPVTCPICGYSLEGLPVSHRCPECAFRYNDQTVVAQPSKPWKAYVSALGAQFLLFLWLGGSIINLLMGVIGRPGTLVALLIGCFIPVLTVLKINAANRKGRYAMLNGEGITVKNFEAEVHIPWRDLSQLAVHDIYPWIKAKGSDQIVSLKGILTNTKEKRAFLAAANCFRKSGDSVTSTMLRTAMRPEHVRATPFKPARSPRLMIAVVVAIAGISATPFLGPRFAPFVVYPAIIYALVLLWNSDKIRRS